MKGTQMSYTIRMGRNPEPVDSTDIEKALYILQLLESEACVSKETDDDPIVCAVAEMHEQRIQTVARLLRTKLG